MTTPEYLNMPVSERFWNKFAELQANLCACAKSLCFSDPDSAEAGEFFERIMCGAQKMEDRVFGNRSKGSTVRMGDVRLMCEGMLRVILEELEKQ